METVTKKMSPLEELQGHFAKTTRRQIQCDLVSVPLFVDPLNSEDYLFVQDAQTLSAAKKIRQLALLVVTKVKTEDGAPAFRSSKGTKDAAETLATSVSPTAFFDLFGAIFDDATAAAVEELGNDSTPSD